MDPDTVMIEWEHEELSLKQLHIIAADSHIECAIYAKDNNLLNSHDVYQERSWQ